MNKQERINRVSINAGDLEVKTFNCAQGTLAALIDEFLPGYQSRAELIKAASMMQGVGGRGETCGALQGALMFFGILYGRDTTEDKVLTPEENQAYIMKMSICTRFAEQFKSDWGSTLCNDVHKEVMGRQYNLMDPSELMQFVQDGADDKCRVVPEYAAKLAAEMILANDQ